MKKTVNPITGERVYSEEVPGGRLDIHVSDTRHYPEMKGSLMNLWVKRGWLGRPMAVVLGVSTYFHDGEGYCWGVYNPALKMEVGEDGLPRSVVDFAWMFEPGEENEARLVAEALRMAREGVRFH